MKMKTVNVEPETYVDILLEYKKPKFKDIDHKKAQGVKKYFQWLMERIRQKKVFMVKKQKYITMTICDTRT